MKNLLINIYILTTLFYTTHSFASCNFVSAKYLKELSDPSEIKSIIIKTIAQGIACTGFFIIYQFKTFFFMISVKKSFFCSGHLAASRSP